MFALPLALSLLAAAPGQPRLYTVLSNQSRLSYHLVHKLHRIDGVSKGVEGKARVLPDGTVQVQVQSRVADFDSGNENRDAHMKEAVEAARYPVVEFKGLGSGLKLPEKGKVTVTLVGQLTFHGVTHPLEVPVTLEAQDAAHLIAQVAFPVSLEAYKVERPELLLVKVDDPIQIELTLALLEKT